MDKEKDTKVIKEIIDKVYGEEPTAVLIRRMPVEYRVICNENVARAIIEAGYHTNDNSALKTYSDSVLMKQTKAWLIDQIRLLEQSCKDYEWQVNNQAKNYEKLLAEEKQQTVREFASNIIDLLDEMGMERSSEYNDGYDDGVTDCITNIKSRLTELYGAEVTEE